MSEKAEFTIQVKGEEPIRAVPPVYSNFWAISRAGTDVQIEFVFLDLNMIAQLLDAAKASGFEKPPSIEGKTVAKLVMPGPAFIQIKEHINRIFKEVEEILSRSVEARNERDKASSG